MSALQAVSGQYEVDSIPALIDRAARDLVSARSAGEVLEARDRAALAYDLAKKAARLSKAKEAHDTLIAAAHRAQARALEIESQAKMRLADEYDAAQERGELARGRPKSIPEQNTFQATAKEAGLDAKAIHEARQFRDAELADPGLISRAINERLDRGEEPTKAYLREVVNEAALEALQGRGQRRDGKNPIHKPNPAFDAVVGLNGACRRANDLIEEYGPESILDGCVDGAMRARCIVLLEACRDNLNRVLESAHA